MVLKCRDIDKIINTLEINSNYRALIFFLTKAPITKREKSSLFNKWF